MTDTDGQARRAGPAATGGRPRDPQGARRGRHVDAGTGDRLRAQPAVPQRRRAWAVDTVDRHAVPAGRGARHHTCGPAPGARSWRHHGRPRRSRPTGAVERPPGLGARPRHLQRPRPEHRDLRVRHVARPGPRGLVRTPRRHRAPSDRRARSESTSNPDLRNTSRRATAWCTRARSLTDGPSRATSRSACSSSSSGLRRQPDRR